MTTLHRAEHEQLERGYNKGWMVRRIEIQLTDKELGRGSWAAVRVAKFRGHRVAAKCFHPILFSDHNMKQFEREMNIAAKVHHPNLVQFIGATMEREPIILTELMETSLRAFLDQTPGLNPAHIKSISLDVARALKYLHLLHPHPIVHRDISGTNVLLESRPNSWRAKVADLGSANFLHELRTPHPGCQAYAAPEAGDPFRQSPKMDVYSYGVLLLELCTQKFPSLYEQEALLQQVQQPAMVALIRQCRAYQPEIRPTMGDIIRKLE